MKCKLIMLITVRIEINMLVIYGLDCEIIRVGVVRLPYPEKFKSIILQRSVR